MGALEPETIWTKPTKTEKTLIKKLFLPITTILLVIGIGSFFVFNQTKDDFELMEELVQKKKWASVENLSAVLRLCQAGNENACELLDKYPEHRNVYIPRINHTKLNAKITDIYNPNFTKSEISTRLYKALITQDKDIDLDTIFQGGLEKIKKIGSELIKELEWLFLERGYDPIDFRQR